MPSSLYFVGAGVATFRWCFCRWFISSLVLSSLVLLLLVLLSLRAFIVGAFVVDSFRRWCFRRWSFRRFVSLVLSSSLHFVGAFVIALYCWRWSYIFGAIISATLQSSPDIPSLFCCDYCLITTELQGSQSSGGTKILPWKLTSCHSVTNSGFDPSNWVSNLRCWQNSAGPVPCWEVVLFKVRRRKFLPSHWRPSVNGSRAGLAIETGESFQGGEKKN